MKKEDLETGMLVLCENGEVGMVINEYIVFQEGYMCSKISDEGHYKTIAVSTVLKYGWLSPCNWTEENLRENLLWERKKEIPEYTMEQLQEKLGEEFKIKK